MLGRRPRKSPQQRGQGAATAKQLGLFLEFNPEEMMQEMNDDCDDGDLEAELAAITGENVSAGKVKAKGKTPLPMDHIEKMAADCMKDLNDDDSDADELEEDNDLLAELQEVLGEGGEGSYDHETETIDTSPVMTDQRIELQTQMPSASSELQQTIEERITKYKEAIINAKKAGESAKVRRYERGLKTLETMLTAVKKGKKVNEDEMPPPVASGKNSAAMPLAMHDLSKSSGDQDKVEDPEKEEKEEVFAVDHELKSSSVAEFPVSETTLQGQDTSGGHKGVGTAFDNSSSNLSMRALLVTREKEYKLAALKAKQEGDLEKAKEYMRTGKKFSMVLEALDSGRPVDLKDMPLAPHDLENPEQMFIPSKPTPSVPVETPQALTAQEFQSKEASGSVQQPKTVLEALQQRLEKYKAAAAQAKASGADRKSRMHERIAKQYQDAIRAYKAGRKVNFSELPVPPGFPPIPGVAHEDGSTMATVLENASRLVKMEEEEEDREDDEGELSAQAPAAKKPTQLPKKPVIIVQPLMVPSAVSQEEISPEKDVSQPVLVTAPEKTASIEHLSPVAREHIEFLESRKKQYLKAAIQAKKKNNLEQAKMYLRTAKSFDPKVELAKTGKLVDISKLPSPPTDDEGDFIFIHHEDVRVSQKAEEVYVQLIKLLQEQHEKCLQYSKQFMHLGNVTETTRFEKLAQNCKKDLEILQLAQAQGLDPPSHHFEERTFKIVRIFSELSSTEMHLIIVRGINLPAPPGVAPNDLDAFVKFEFHYPNSEQAQKSKTSVIKNTNCPEYDQLFKLNINRNHRGFRRAIQAKGIKFEILHKGSFFRSDKQVGVAHLKLDRLESECEIREIIEVLDGRKSTGGKLEVKVKLREPLSGQDLQTITENWLVLDH